MEFRRSCRATTTSVASGDDGRRRRKGTAVLCSAQRSPRTFGLRTPTQSRLTRRSKKMAIFHVPAAPSSPDLDAFAAGLTGRLIRPGDDDYDTSRHVHNA